MMWLAVAEAFIAGLIVMFVLDNKFVTHAQIVNRRLRRKNEGLLSEIEEMKDDLEDIANEYLSIAIEKMMIRNGAVLEDDDDM